MAKNEREPLSVDDKFELLIAALAQKQGEGITKDDLAEILANNAQSMKKALKPENEKHSNVSAFHPKGGPHMELPYECFYLNFPLHKSVETCHDRELELLLQVKPGSYRILRKDLSDMEVTVRADTTPTGKITRLFIEFPVAREEKHQIPPMHVVLYQLAHPEVSAHRRYLDAMNEHLQVTLVGSES